MGFYDDKILPHVINACCGMPEIMKLRSKVVPKATGRVLEIGMGSGINLPFYDTKKVEFVWGLEPSDGMRRKARKNIEASDIEVKWLDLPSEEIPLEDNSADTVLLTYTLCTIPDWETALQQMRRVLKPGGKLLFCEHGRSPDRGVAKWQDRVTPAWKRVAGGCHLNRPIKGYLERGGFEVSFCENVYVDRAPKIAGYMYYGEASAL